jgi:hypothetical protein
VNANGVGVGVLIDSKNYGIRFVKGSFVNCLCRDRKSNMLGVAQCLSISIQQLGVSTGHNSLYDSMRGMREIDKLREELPITFMIFLCHKYYPIS